MPQFREHPIPKGIENLFSRETVKKAANEKLAFVDIKDTHKFRIRGKDEVIPESWSVNADEKRILCDWLCDQGTCEDFRNFECTFEILEQINAPLEKDPL